MGLWVNTVERIMQRFVVKTDDCWIWTGKKDYGYGRVGFEGTHVRAHRLIYEALRGPIPEGLTLDHLCRNRACVNPDHLDPVTIGENVRRGIGSKTHCANGHPLSGDNLYQTANQRACKTCRREATRRHRLSKVVNA